MEFEKNAPTTPRDEALAAAPRVTLQPVHSELTSDFSNAPLVGARETKRTFEFETESTVEAATTSKHANAHPYRAVAAVLAGAIALLFAGGLYLVYSLR